jgi:hypothetical protein
MHQHYHCDAYAAVDGTADVDDTYADLLLLT